MRAATTCIKSQTLLAKTARQYAYLQVSAYRHGTRASLTRGVGMSAKKIESVRVNLSVRCAGSGKSRPGRCPQRIKGGTRPSLCRDLAWLRGVGPRSHRRVLARLLTCVKRYRSLRLSRGRMPSSTWNISRPAPSPQSLGIFALGHQKRRTHHAAW